MAVKQSITLLALAGGLLASSGATSSSRVSTLFLSGTPAPTGLTFASFGRAATNATGTVCFYAGWDGLRHRPEGLYLRQGGQIVPIARAGDPIPGSKDRFSFAPDYPDEFQSFSLNTSDQVAFLVRQGLFLYAEGSVRPIIRIGDPVAGLPDQNWDEIDTVSLNNAGEIACTGAIRSTVDGDRQAGVFVVSESSVSIALFDGDQLPDLDGPLDGFAGVSLNDRGDMAVLATEGDDGLGCVLLATATDAHALAVEGGTSPTGTWSYLGSAALNNSDLAVFSGREIDASGEHAGIYRAADGVTGVAHTGQVVDDGSGLVVGESLGRPIIDDDGGIACVAGLEGGAPAQGLLLARNGHITLLAAQASSVPGAGPGAISRFSGLCLGSASSAGLVCGVSLAGGPIADALVRFPFAAAPETLATTDTALPPGSLLTLADGDTPSRNVQALISRSGEAVFAADVGGYGRALFRVGADGPDLLTPLGQINGEGAAIRSIIWFDLNDAGQIAYLGTQDEADQRMTIEARDLYSTLDQMVAATGEGLPGDTDRRLSWLGAPAIDASGAVFFAGGAQSTADPAAPNRSYLLRSQHGQIAPVAAEGQLIDGTGTLASLPDADPGALTSLFRELHVNNAGQALFISSYQDQKTGAFNPAALFLLSDGLVRPVALPGQAAPLPGAPVYTGFSTPRLSDDGAVTFAASVAGASRKPRAGLFRIDATGAAALAAVGDSVPGWDGETYRAVSDPATNGSAGAAFLALVDPPPTAASAAALLLAGGTTPQVALLNGDPADPPNGLRFRGDDRFPPAPLALKDDGSLLVAGQLSGGAAPDGLFLLRPN
jgi:hypothetical protein